jgi:hypothetical protein
LNFNDLSLTKDTGRKNCLGSGETSVQTIRPNTAAPIPARAAAPKMGTIIVRFSGLLLVAVALLAFAWSR